MRQTPRNCTVAGNRGHESAKVCEPLTNIGSLNAVPNRSVVSFPSRFQVVACPESLSHISVSRRSVGRLCSLTFSAPYLTRYSVIMPSFEVLTMIVPFSRFPHGKRGAFSPVAVSAWSDRLAGLLACCGSYPAETRKSEQTAGFGKRQSPALRPGLVDTGRKRS